MLLLAVAADMAPGAVMVATVIVVAEFDVAACWLCAGPAVSTVSAIVPAAISIGRLREVTDVSGCTRWSVASIAPCWCRRRVKITPAAWPRQHAPRIGNIRLEDPEVFPTAPGDPAAAI